MLLDHRSSINDRIIFHIVVIYLSSCCGRELKETSQRFLGCSELAEVPVTGNCWALKLKGTWENCIFLHIFSRCFCKGWIHNYIAWLYCGQTIAWNEQSWCQSHMGAMATGLAFLHCTSCTFVRCQCIWNLSVTHFLPSPTSFSGPLPDSLISWQHGVSEFFLKHCVCFFVSWFMQGI